MRLEGEQGALMQTCRLILREEAGLRERDLRLRGLGGEGLSLTRRHGDPVVLPNDEFSVEARLGGVEKGPVLFREA